MENNPNEARADYESRDTSRGGPCLTASELDEHIAFIAHCLRLQEEEQALSAYQHNKLIRLLGLGLVGMDGFRYMWPEKAKENRRRTLLVLKRVHA